MSTLTEDIGQFLAAGYRVVDVATGQRVDEWFALLERRKFAGYDRLWLRITQEQDLHLAQSLAGIG